MEGHIRIPVIHVPPKLLAQRSDGWRIAAALAVKELATKGVLRERIGHDRVSESLRRRQDEERDDTALYNPTRRPS